MSWRQQTKFFKVKGTTDFFEIEKWVMGDKKEYRIKFLGTRHNCVKEMVQESLAVAKAAGVNFFKKDNLKYNRKKISTSSGVPVWEISVTEKKYIRRGNHFFPFYEKSVLFIETTYGKCIENLPIISQENAHLFLGCDYFQGWEKVKVFEVKTEELYLNIHNKDNQFSTTIIASPDYSKFIIEDRVVGIDEVIALFPMMEERFLRGPWIQGYNLGLYLYAILLKKVQLRDFSAVEFDNTGYSIYGEKFEWPDVHSAYWTENIYLNIFSVVSREIKKRENIFDLDIESIMNEIITDTDVISTNLKDVENYKGKKLGNLLNCLGISGRYYIKIIRGEKTFLCCIKYNYNGSWQVWEDSEEKFGLIKEICPHYFKKYGTNSTV